MPTLCAVRKAGWRAALVPAVLAWALCASCAGGTAGESAGAGRPVEAGMQAPGFSLPNQDGEAVALSDLGGRWVVLYFYPSDDTPGCTAQATEFTELLDEFRTDGAVVLGVSADPPLSHRFFRQKHELEVTLLSDVDRDAMRDYNVWRETDWRGATVGRTVRTTFLIAPDGRIAWKWDHVVPHGHAAEVRDRMRELSAAGGL